MAEPLKDLYNTPFFRQFSSILKQAYPSLDEQEFIARIFDKEWEQRELKQRMRHVTHTLASFLPPSYEDAVRILMQIAPQCRGFEYLFFPDFIQVYGLERFELSIEALKCFTSSSSSEFAVRPFIEQAPAHMMAVMEQWAADDNPHVRRLASEGCRPRLPWAPPLRGFIADPAPILPILRQLKADESEYVRKSVANNLNDISKDHPELVTKISAEWKGQHPHTDWIIKHGCRTLLRKANPAVLELFGFSEQPPVQITELTLSASQLRIGEALSFHFTLENPSSSPVTLRVEYGIDFVKANGQTSRKLFKITENTYKSGETSFQRNHSFKDLSTRKHYSGKHRLSIVMNGQTMAEANFELVLHSPNKALV